MKTDEEIKNLAGHPDAIPAEWIEWFLKGYKVAALEYGIKPQRTDFKRFYPDPMCESDCALCGKPKSEHELLSAEFPTYLFCTKTN